MIIQMTVKQGLEADRLSFVPARAELVYSRDTKKLFIGDGATPGGNPVDTELVITEGQGSGNIMVMDAEDASTFKGVSKADFLADYQLKVDVADGYVPQSTVAFDVSDITPDKIPTNKVVSARLGVLDDRVTQVSSSVPVEALSAVEQAIPQYFQQDAMGALAYRRVFFGINRPNNPQEGDVFIQF